VARSRRKTLTKIRAVPVVLVLASGRRTTKVPNTVHVIPNLAASDLIKIAEITIGKKGITTRNEAIIANQEVKIDITGTGRIEIRSEIRKRRKKKSRKKKSSQLQLLMQ
jgi:hypothetical protein